jgi:hypothetical protein
MCRIVSIDLMDLLWSGVRGELVGSNWNWECAAIYTYVDNDGARAPKHAGAIII